MSTFSRDKPMTTVLEGHIRLDDRGVAWVDDSNIKVIEVALDQIANGWSADEIFRQHNGYLSLAQIHAALSYYFDHKTEFDAEIERQVREFDRLREESLNSPIRQKLRDLGKIP